MSALDKLRSFDADWERHVDSSRKSQKYLAKREPGVVILHVSRLPSAVEEMFFEELEKLMTGTLDAYRDACRSRLVEAARVEAKATLKELGDVDT